MHHILLYKYIVINGEIYWINTDAERKFATRIMSTYSREKSDIYLTKNPNDTIKNKGANNKNSYIGTLHKNGKVTYR